MPSIVFGTAPHPCTRPSLVRRHSLVDRLLLCAQGFLKESFQGHKRMAHARERRVTVSETRARNICAVEAREPRARAPQALGLARCLPPHFDLRILKRPTRHARRTRPARGTLAGVAAPHRPPRRATLPSRHPPQGATVLNVRTQNIVYLRQYHLQTAYTLYRQRVTESTQAYYPPPPPPVRCHSPR